MKRLNPKTGKPFKSGDVREDGYIFSQYNLYMSVKKDGFYFETWRHPNKHAAVKKYHETYNKTEKRKIYFQRACSKWSKNNRGKRNAITAKRNASKLQRTPIWLTKEHYKQIADFYKKAKELDTLTGIKHHVDHIVPLQGENVSGLHVPWNLQILTATENCSKHNSF
jgi:5-methylcytosine-specific restriction endonuclease McrA